MGERADVTRAYDPNAQDFDRTIESGTEGESPEEIRAEIVTTRTEMSGTIDAIQEKLNPDRLKEQVVETVREQVETVKENIHDATIGRAEEMVSNVSDTARNAGSGFVDTIKQNPIPAALAALGIGWLWKQRSSGSSQGNYSTYGQGRISYTGGQPMYGRGQAYGASYGERRGQMPYDGGQDDQSVGDRVGGVANQAKDKVGDVTGQAKEKVGDATDQAREQVGQLTDQVQYGAQQARWRFDQTLHDNPLAVSAAAVALGLAVGMSLPETPFEDKLMGETRDNVMEKAQSTAQETMQKVGQVAQQVQQTATETAKDEAQKQGLTQGPSPQGGSQKQPQAGAQTMPRPPQQGQQGAQPMGTPR